MADAVRIGVLSGDATQPGRVRHQAHARGGTDFHHLLTGALQSRVAGISPAHGPILQAAAGIRLSGVARAAKPVVVKPLSAIPASSAAALDQAMTLEGVPASWKDGLSFIMAQESSGKVDARNPVHSARGLFQLTAANYHLNPQGAASFGNAVEEAQGGIRYIRQRYGTADNAVHFWQNHHWY